MKTKPFVVFSLLLLCFNSLGAITYHEQSMHLLFELNESTKEAVVGTGVYQERNALPYPPLGSNENWYDYWRNLVIPSTITYNGDNYTVIGISNYAFHKSTTVESVILPSSVRYIGNEAFSWCTELKQIYIPNNSQLTTINNSAFYLCHQLEKITLPTGLKTISASAFRECWNLKKINIPGTCTEVGNDAFSWCTSLSNIIIEEGNTPLNVGYSYTLSINYQGSDKPRFRGLFADCPADTIFIGRSQFICPIANNRECRPFLTIANYGDMTTSAYRGLTGKNIKVLQFGDKVTAVQDSLFWNSTVKNNVSLPKNLKYIGDYSFYFSDVGCLKQDSLIIPDSVRYIGENAFADCSINKLKILGPCNEWGKGAFSSIGVKDLYIGVNVNKIGSIGMGTNVYVKCLPYTPPSDNNIFRNNPIFVSRGAGKQYREKWADAIIIDESDDFVVINVRTPGTLYSRLIAQDYQLESVFKLKLKGTLSDEDVQTLFQMTKLYSLDLSELEIEELPRKFKGNTQLLNVQLPKELKRINEEDFKGCVRLSGEVHIPSTCRDIGKSAFEGTSIEKITFNGSVSIDSMAFKDCQKLADIKFNNLSHIGAFSFVNCTNLCRIQFDDSVIIEPRAFNGLSIDSIYIPSGSMLKENAFAEADVKIFSFDDNIQSIGDNALSLHVENVILGGMIDSIGVNSYPKLKEIHVSDISTWCKLPFPDSQVMENSPYLYIGDEIAENVIIPNDVKLREYVFYNCETLISVVITSEISTIPISAFENCNNLKRIELPQTIYAIEANAFKQCSALDSLELSSSLHTIGKEAFYLCRQLNNLKLPCALKIIEDGAFYGCSSLESLDLPLSLLSIGELAFSTCDNLSSIKARWNNPFTINSNTFTYVAKDCCLYIPIMSANNYNAAGWKVPSLKETGIMTLQVEGGGMIQYEENIVREITKNFLFSPFKTFYLTVKPDNGFVVRKIELNGENIMSLVEDETIMIEEPEKDILLRVVFGDSTLEMGDTNGNHLIDDTDALAIVCYILDYSQSVFYDYLADVNNDEVINVTDALIVISWFLNGN